MRAAMLLQVELRQGVYAGLGQTFETAGYGKMFGVLVVRDPLTRIGFIRAASGTIGGSWRPAGFVPPLFDDAARDGFWPAGQDLLAALEKEIVALANGPEAKALVQRLADLKIQHQAREATFKAWQKEAKAERALRRNSEILSKEELLALSHQSQALRREGKELRAKHQAELDALVEEKRLFDLRVRALKQRRADTSNALLTKIQDGYNIRNALAETCALASLYEGVAPGGSADCAGPKLLGYAYENTLTPIAFAEFWWGASPPGGGRHSGQFYPACRGKCGPLLPFMLKGLAHQAAPKFGSETPQKHPPETIYDDPHLFAVNKPEPMLSVPGRTAALRDSALTRLREAHIGPGKPIQIHRLDRDTSGVMLYAKTHEAHRGMQALFEARKIEKTYVAWLDGNVAADRGRIELALRVDLEDRPRQVVCAEHGKEAVTDYEVLARHQGLTKVAFYPRTGRTHQLRVHAAHPLGLAAPILGDRLYGKPASRLFLHAQALSFAHPVGGHQVQIACPPDDQFDAKACS
tara:strand:+ start:1887 stop:3455 length:1569 start_codon:yes stop_codon:yes gene_type:complete